MDNVENELVDQMVTSLKQLLRGKISEPINIIDENYPDSLAGLAECINELLFSFAEIWAFILPLSQGELNINSPKARNILASPFKELHSQLRTLVWQVQQIAEGDYKQRVYFMGEFSKAFNQMVESLQQKDQVVQEHLKYLENEARISRENEARYASVVRNSPGGLYIFDPVTCKVLDANENFKKLMGYGNEEILVLTVYDFYHDQSLAQDDLDDILDKSLHSIANRWYEKKNGEKVIFDITTCWSTSGQSTVVIVSLQDVTERNKAQETMEFLASHDVLTSVLNRFALEENYKKMVEQVNQGDTGALILIDIDNFKLINDTFGHNVGDMVLMNLVTILKENLRDGDILARLGGDEFVILLSKVSMPKANIVAERLRDAVEKTKFSPINLGFLFNYTVSIGIAPVQNPAPKFQELILQADYALYQSKEQGRNRVSSTTNLLASQNKISETNKMMRYINEAIEAKRFVLYFQPIVDLLTGETIHHEALMRIVTKSGEIIYPSRVISVAERFGQMSTIDKQIIKLSFEALTKYPDMRLFVNLSGASIGDDKLQSYIEENLESTGIEPSRLGFEITETTVIKDMVRADRWIKHLKQRGCPFALDDFGTGCSSFSYLKYLSVDYVKIDGSYIRNLKNNKKKRALVEAMYTVAHSLGKEVIAEFIEDEAIIEILNEINIGYGQGYYLGHPEPVPQFPMVISK